MRNIDGYNVMSKQYANREIGENNPTLPLYQGNVVTRRRELCGLNDGGKYNEEVEDATLFVLRKWPFVRRGIHDSSNTTSIGWRYYRDFFALQLLKSQCPSRNAFAVSSRVIDSKFIIDKNEGGAETSDAWGYAICHRNKHTICIRYSQLMKKSNVSLISWRISKKRRVWRSWWWCLRNTTSAGWKWTRRRTILRGYRTIKRTRND